MSLLLVAIDFGLLRARAAEFAGSRSRRLIALHRVYNSEGFGRNGGEHVFDWYTSGAGGP